MNSDSNWFRYDAATGRLSLTLHVQPNARRSEIAGRYGDALKVRVAAPAADNKANAALIGFLSEVLRVPRTAIAIRHGTTARRKVIEVSGGAELVTVIGNLR